MEGTDIYINGVDDMASQFIKDLNIPTPPIRPARYALGHQVYQAVTFLDREHEGQLLDRAPHLLTTRWHPNFLDVIPPTGGKDKGLEAVLAHFGIPVEESMAFGDGENDLAMLVRAGEMGELSPAELWAGKNSPHPLRGEWLELWLGKLRRALEGLERSSQESAAARRQELESVCQELEDMKKEWKAWQ